MVRISRVMLFSAAFAILGSAKAETCRMTGETAYISGSGIRLRKEPSTTAAVVKILKFNYPICDLKEKKNGWMHVFLQDPEPKEGWIPVEFAANKPVEEMTIMSELNNARSSNDLKKATMWAERLVDVSQGQQEIEALKQLQVILEQSGDKKRSALIAKQIEEAQARGLTGDEFNKWFFTKFGDTSPYFRIPEVLELSDADIDQLIKALLEPTGAKGEGAEGESGDADAMDRYREPIKKILVTVVYPKAFGRGSKNPWTKKTSERLQNPLLVKEVVRADRAMIRLLPADAIQKPAVLDVIVANCPKYGSRDEKNCSEFWTALKPEQRRARAEDILDCIPEAEIPKFLNALKLNDDENFLFSYMQNAKHYPHFRALYSGMSDRLKNSPKVLAFMMDPSRLVDLYAVLPEKLQKSPQMKEYAVKTSSCSDIMRVNPSDEGLLNKIIEGKGLTTECPKVMAPSLNDNPRIAMRMVTKNPNCATHLGPRTKFDPKIILQAASSAASTFLEKSVGCPIEHLGQVKDIAVKRQVVKLLRGCLAFLDAKDFSDSAIYKTVIAERINVPLMEHLPDRYTLDPNVYTQLELEHATEAQLRRYQNKQVMVDVVKKGGIRAVQTHFHFHCDDQDGCSILNSEPFTDSTFWEKLATESKKKGDSCGDWAQFKENVYYINSTAVEAIDRIMNCPQ